VYAWIDGGEQPNEVIVVGAHFDHVGNSPGADDNASGTVLVLELAQAFSMLPKKEIKRTLVFQLYSGEEMGLLGSKAYCANPKFPKEAPGMGKHVFMLNADMVGRLNGHQYTMLYEEMVDDIGQIVQDLSSRYRFALSITKRGAGGSDQTPFLNKGVPVAWLFTGSHRDYHRSTDTADKIDYDGLEKISRYAFELVYRVDHNKRYMQLNYDDYDKGTSEFNESLYDHDQPSTPFPYPLRKDSGF
jgi:Zn-dependent M28 family amino/carboxypeptidase